MGVSPQQTLFSLVTYFKLLVPSSLWVLYIVFMRCKEIISRGVYRMKLDDWHAEFKAEYHKEELCQVLKNFTGILNFLVKQFNQF